MSIKRRLAFAFTALAATAAMTAGVAVAAGAASLSCTSKPSCGGATLVYASKGSLDLSVLSPDANVNGGNGYWNEEVGFTASSTSNLAQDFRVAQVRTSNPLLVPGLASPMVVAKGGSYNQGDYVAVYDPAGVPLTSIATPYCISVEDTYPTVGGHVVQRWALVLRTCSTVISGFQGTPSFTAPHTGSNTTDEWVADNPDPYQVWAPVGVNNPQSLEFQNVGLNNASLRHGYAGQNFVIDDRGFGGAGTWGLAFPENDGANQKFIINGCSDPITSFNAIYYNCPTGVTPSP